MSNKGVYVPYTSSKEQRDSMKSAWDEMAKFKGSKHAFDYTIFEAATKLRGFVSDDVLVDYNSCDTTYGLVSWNDVTFGNMKHFDFGQTIVFASNGFLKRIFVSTSARPVYIHSINDQLKRIMNNLFKVGYKLWLQPITCSICGPYLTCAKE